MRQDWSTRLPPTEIERVPAMSRQWMDLRPGWQQEAHRYEDAYGDWAFIARLQRYRLVRGAPSLHMITARTGSTPLSHSRQTLIDAER